MSQRSRRPGRERLLDVAIEMAEHNGWEALRLHQVATACGAGLDDVRRHFREKDEIIDAWFDRADAAMLRVADAGELDDMPPRERIRRLCIAWLAALQPHRRVTRQMIAHKLEPGHLHVQLREVLRISRTVQWLREAALLDAPLPRRAVEEAALTALFVNAFLRWLADNSPDFRNTRRWLDRRLYVLEVFGRTVPGGRFGGGMAGVRPPAAGDIAPTDD